jgi:proline iminopeptidase
VWPKADFAVVADAGHSAKEPGIISELVKATDKYREL